MKEHGSIVSKLSTTASTNSCVLPILHDGSNGMDASMNDWKNERFCKESLQGNQKIQIIILGNNDDD